MTTAANNASCGTNTLNLQPPEGGWRDALRAWLARESPCRDRVAVREHVQDNAQRLGTGRLGGADDVLSPWIATGHQAWLWHPGILAKDIAAAELARAVCDSGTESDGRQGACWLHLVVDQDVHEALTIDLPVREGERLTVKTLRLAVMLPGVPTGMQPPVDAASVVRVLRDQKDARLTSLTDAWDDLPPTRTLAEQLAVVTVRLMRPWTGSESAPVLMVTQLCRTSAFEELVAAMLEEAADCVATYNAAVSAHPQAGVGPLAIERERVELPLWALTWERPRQRVYADLADSSPLLTTEDGRPIDPATQVLAPRALLLTALMRGGSGSGRRGGALCDLFIHGLGGGVYDQATEAWWRGWRGQPLCPMGVVSADVRMDFDVPVASRADVTRAVWRRHHLPHNLDRVLKLEGPWVERKRELLGRMNDDRDKARRRAAFSEVHRINAKLAVEHSKAIEDADVRLGRARIGLSNQRSATRRDWCFALYPLSKLKLLRRQLAEHFIALR